MIYNNGSTTNFDKIEDYIKAAKEFSEGDKELEKLLLYCFSNRIKTVACCKGHKENKSLPYIAFSYNENNKEFIYNLMSLFNNYDINISFVKSIGGYIFSIRSIKEDFELFKTINNYLEEKTKDINITDDFKQYIDIMDTSYENAILNNENFRIEYLKEKDIIRYTFGLYGLESCEIFENLCFKKYDAPYAVYSINDLDRQCLSDKLNIIRNSLKQTNIKR